MLMPESIRFFYYICYISVLICSLFLLYLLYLYLGLFAFAIVSCSELFDLLLMENYRDSVTIGLFSLLRLLYLYLVSAYVWIFCLFCDICYKFVCFFGCICCVYFVFTFLLANVCKFLKFIPNWQYTFVLILMFVTDNYMLCYVCRAFYICVFFYICKSLYICRPIYIRKPLFDGPYGCLIIYWSVITCRIRYD